MARVNGVKIGVLPSNHPLPIRANTPEERAALVSKFAHFKPTAMSAPFLAAFEEQAAMAASNGQEKGELRIVRYREEEAIFVQASADRVTVIFSTVFKEETDRVYGRLFLSVSRV